MSNSRQGFLAGGNFITDFVKIIEAWPEQDTLATIHSQSMSNGGGPYNILKNLSILAPKLPREACGLIGNDANGDWILSDCQNAEIEISQLRRTSKAATSYTDAMTVAASGRRTFFHQRGANALLTPGYFDFSKTQAKVFMLGYLMLLDSLDQNGGTGATEVLRNARQAGLITAVDCVSEPSPHFRDIVLSTLNDVDLLFLNDFEIGQVLGREVSGKRPAMERAALELAALAPRESTRVIVHSANGAVVAKRNGTVTSQPSVALPETEIAGATGAGDAFASGFLLGVHNDQDSQTCLKYAVSTAAMSLHDPTPSAGMKSLPQCLELAERYGFKGFD